MKLFVMSIAVLLLIAIGVIVSPAVTCLYTGERESGLMKICFYDCIGSPGAITVPFGQMCPLSTEIGD